MGNEYNGWTNRATWLTNMYFGDGIQEMLQEAVDQEEITEETTVYELSSLVEEFVDAILDEELDQLSGFLSDMLDLNQIDYYDIAGSCAEELDYPEEEEEEEE